MKEMSLSTFRRLKATEIKDMLPVTITAEGVPVAQVVNPDDVIVIGDLHPRLQNRFRAMEKKSRIGMPKVEKVKVGV